MIQTPQRPSARWLALAAALLGWMFDGAEMGLFSLVGRPAIMDLLATKDESVVGQWFGIVMASFLVGAATGGVLFGWLGDRLGRVRAMTLSVFTYAVFTGLCGLANAAWQVGVLRFIAALGMGGEWSLGVALVMEVWPDRSRAFMAGLIGAAANVGFLLVGFVGLGLVTLLAQVQAGLEGIGLPPAMVAALLSNRGWRLMMILGALPALLTFFIRLFVPESERWQKEANRGATAGWATQDLSGVVAGVAGPALIVYLWAYPHATLLRLVGTLAGLGIALVGYTFPVVRYFQRLSGDKVRRQARNAMECRVISAQAATLRRMLLAACLSAVALLGTWGSVQWAPSWSDKLTEQDTMAGIVRSAKEYTQIALALGAIAGTILAALMGDWFGRRRTYTLLCLLSLISVLVLYQTNQQFGAWFVFTAFVAGACTASFYGWLPLYLPELFGTSVRATGQGFSFNFGRILAAVGTLQTGVLFKTDLHLGSISLPAGYPSACSLMSLIYVVGIFLIWLAPETKGKPLPE